MLSPARATVAARSGAAAAVTVISDAPATRRARLSLRTLAVRSRPPERSGQPVVGSLQSRRLAEPADLPVPDETGPSAVARAEVGR
jgi:hypothetical protein